MVAEFAIHPLAEHDINDAYDWYERQRFGLGEEFMSCLDACFQLIRRMPELAEIVVPGARRALVRRFPYGVLYEYIGDRVVVLCVFHLSRRDATWRKRLP